MFTGIIECLGEVVMVSSEGSNQHLWIKADFVDELKIDQSIAHNGVCLTVVDIQNGLFQVTAIAETLNRSNLGTLLSGDIVNLERCMSATGRFDGHIVQGHVDTTAILELIEPQNGSWKFQFLMTEPHNGLIVNKGSIAVNGVSLTVAECGERSFSVAIIPYTLENTGFSHMHLGDNVNIEFDILGKYVRAMLKKQM